MLGVLTPITGSFDIEIMISAMDQGDLGMVPGEVNPYRFLFNDGHKVIVHLWQARFDGIADKNIHLVNLISVDQADQRVDDPNVYRVS